MKACLMFLRALLGTVLIVTAVTTSAEPAPNSSLVTDNGTVSLASLKGQVLYVDFWASWCLPCVKSFPWMQKMQETYGQNGFKVIAINLDNDKANAKRFLEDKSVSFLLAYDAEGQLAKQFKVTGMPNSFLIDRQGNIVSTHVGFKEKDVNALEGKIRAATSR